MQGSTDEEQLDWELGSAGSHSQLSIPFPCMIAGHLFSFPEQRPLILSHHAILAAPCLERSPPIWILFSKLYTCAAINPIIKC